MVLLGECPVRKCFSHTFGVLNSAEHQEGMIGIRHLGSACQEIGPQIGSRQGCLQPTDNARARGADAAGS